MSQYDYAMTLQSKVLAKYGAEYGIAPGILDRIGNGTATASELTAYTTNADKLVDRFKADMRRTEPADYSDADVEIIVAMAATNYATFQARDEPFSKVMPAKVVGFNLSGGPPTIGGFAAMDRYSADLSPQQIVSQFGLDYESKGVTPFLVSDAGKLVPQPFVYALKSPMSDEIRDNARIPFDPRVLARIEALAKDPSKAGDAVQEMARMVSRPEICMLAARAGGDQVEALKAYKDRGFHTQEGTTDAPYTGNAMPQFGDRLENRSSYSDLIQETAFTKRVVAAAGTAIYLKIPRPGSQDPSAPQGSVETKVAEWDGQKWQMTVTKAELDAAHEQALASVSLSDTARAELKKRMVTHESLTTDLEKGKAKERLDTPLPEAVKKKIAEDETAAKRALLTNLTGDALVATAAVKLKKKTKLQEEQEKKRKKKLREDDEDDEQENERADSEKQEKQQQQEQSEQEQSEPSAEPSADAGGG